MAQSTEPSETNPEGLMEGKTQATAVGREAALETEAAVTEDTGVAQAQAAELDAIEGRLGTAASVSPREDADGPSTEAALPDEAGDQIDASVAAAVASDGPASDACPLEGEAVPPVAPLVPPEAPDKIRVHFKAVGSAPILRQTKFQVQSAWSFAELTTSLRNQLKLPSGTPLHVYCNSAFEPSGDQSLADLFRCFQAHGELLMSYSHTEAWG